MRHPMGAALFVAAVLAAQAGAQGRGDDLKKAEGRAKEIVAYLPRKAHPSLPG